jgi:epoxyqueuosine reductase QueG
MKELLERMAEQQGARFLGIADLTAAEEVVREQGGDLVSGLPRAVSVGVALPKVIVDQLDRQLDRAVMMNYNRHGYDVINARLDFIVSMLAGTLASKGYRALPVPASQTLDSERELGLFSHKLAAHLAGLGWIGKSCLLVTPQVGPRVRWATVLTDAPLEPAGETLKDGCGSCTKCVDICPVHAFTGRAFQADKPRGDRFDVHKCHAHQLRMKQQIDVALCGLCLYICPFGH